MAGGVVLSKQDPAAAPKPPAGKLRIVADQSGRLAFKDESGTVVTPEALIGSLETLVGTKQDASSAATDVELASAIGTVNSAIAAEETARKGADAALAGSAAAAKAVADAALPKSGGTMTGDITLAGDPTNNLHPATKQYVAAQIAALVNGAPGALDTLKEIADQLAGDESAASALVNTVANLKLDSLADVSIPDPDNRAIVRWNETNARFDSATLGEMLGHFRVADYGALGDDTTDDQPAVDVAHTAALKVAEAGGTAVVEYDPKGTYYLGSGGGLSLKANLSGKLIVRGRGAKVRLSSGCPRFYDTPFGSKHDTFQNIEIEGFRIDAGNIAGKHHVILGNYINGSNQLYTNFKAIRVRDIDVTNVYVADDAGASYRAGVYLLVKQELGPTEEPTQNFVEDVRVERVTMNGGLTGVYIAGDTKNSEATYANVRMDDVHLADSKHVLAESPISTSVIGSSNFQLGGRAIGGYATMRGLYGKCAGDVGIEYNNFTSMIIEDCVMEDARTANYYHAPHGRPGDAQAQAAILRSCRARRYQTTVSGGSAGFKTGPGLNPYPTAVFFEDCRFHSTVSKVAVSGGDAFVFSTGNPIISLKSCASVIANAKYTTPTTAIVPTVILMDTGADCNFIVDGFNSYYSGERESGAGAMNVTHLRINGLASLLDVRNFRVNEQVTNISSGSIMVDLGAKTNATHTLRGKVELVVLGHTDTAPKMVYVRTAEHLAIDGSLEIEVDSRKATAGTEVAFDAGATSLKPLIHQRRRRYRTASVPAAIELGASPAVYQNVDGYQERLYLKPGDSTTTISNIEIAKDGETWTSVGALDGSVVLDNGDSVRVTYAGTAPKATKLEVK